MFFYQSIVWHPISKIIERQTDSWECFCDIVMPDSLKRVWISTQIAAKAFIFELVYRNKLCKFKFPTVIRLIRYRNIIFTFIQVLTKNNLVIII